MKMPHSCLYLLIQIRLASWALCIDRFYIKGPYFPEVWVLSEIKIRPLGNTWGNSKYAMLESSMNYILIGSEFIGFRYYELGMLRYVIIPYN